MTTDQLIQAALTHAAEQAPDPRRVQAELAGRARARRRRRTLLVAVAAASCVVVAAAAVTWWPRLHAQPTVPPPHSSCPVAIYLADAITPEQKQRLDADLRRTTGVTEVDYESKEDAYQRFKEMFKDAPDQVNSVQPDTLPAAFRFTATDPEVVAAIRAQYTGLPGITSVNDWCELARLTPTR